MRSDFERAHSYATAIIQLGRFENTDVTNAMSDIAIILDNVITKLEDSQKAEKNRHEERAFPIPAV